MQEHHQQRPHEHDLFLLGAIAGFLHWLESLATILSGPLLTIGLGIALVDLLTDGQLLTTEPALLWTWAVTQAIGVDSQLVGSSFRISRSVRSGKPWAALGYGVLVVLLAYVAFIAAQIFATQQSEGITTAQALQQLGLDSTAWIWQRAGLSVLLVVLSGLLRYQRPAKIKASAAAERETLERELELEPLRQRLRAQKAVGARSLAVRVLTGKDDSQDAVSAADAAYVVHPLRPGDQRADTYMPAPVTPDNLGGADPTPSTGSKPRGGRPMRLVESPSRSRGRRRSAPKRGSDNWEQEARTAFADGARSKDAMVAQTGMKATAAATWVRTLKAEEKAHRAGREQERQAVAQ